MKGSQTAAAETICQRTQFAMYLACFFSMLFVLLSNLARNVVLRVEGLILVFYHPNSVVEIHPPRVLLLQEDFNKE